MSGPNPLGAIAVGVGAGLLNHFLSPNSENKIELIENIQQCVEAVKILRLREVTEVSINFFSLQIIRYYMYVLQYINIKHFLQLCC